MIDTLKLSLNDYAISRGAHLDVQPSVFNAATGELLSNFPLWHDGSRYIEGSKAFHNGEDFNVTIKPLSPSQPDSIGCLVQFSVPKVVTGSNFHATDHNGTVAALKAVEKHLRDVGIKTNIKTASMSRVDAFKTIQTDEPYPAYHSVLSMLQGQRMAKRDYGTTFLWANTQQEICIYDKLVEMQQRKASVAGFPENSVRFEHRMLKARKVQKTLGMKTVADLLAGYDHVRDTYNAVMEKQLFRRTVSDVAMLTSTQLEEELAYYQDVLGRRYWLRDWQIANGMRAVAPDVEALKTAVKNRARGRNTARNLLKQIESAALDAAAQAVIRPAKRPIGELYSELKRKILL